MSDLDFDTSIPTGVTPSIFPPIPGMKPDVLKPLQRDSDNAKTMRELAAGREKNLTLQQAELARRADEFHTKASGRIDALQGDVKTAEADLVAVPKPEAAVLPDPKIGEVVDKKNLSSAVFAIIGMSLIGAAGGRGNWKMAAAGIDGALKGYKEGSITKYKEHVDAYKREYDQALEKERASIAKYNDILKSKEYSLNTKMRMIQLQAVADGREELRFNAERKNYEKVATDIAKMLNNAAALDAKATHTYESLVAAGSKLEEKRKADEKRASAKAEGKNRMSPAAINDAASQFRRTGVIPSAFRDTESRALVQNRAAEQRVEHGTTADAELASRVDMKAVQSAYTQITKDLAAIRPYKVMLDKNADIAMDLAEKAIATDAKLANKPLNWVMQNAGDNPDLAEFLAQTRILSTEAARVLNNPRLVGQLTDSARHEMEQVLSGDMPLSAFKRVVTRMKIDGTNRVSAMEDEAKELLERASGKPAASASPAAPAATAAPKNAKGWELHTDKNGAKAYVSPDGKQFEEVK